MAWAPALLSACAGESSLEDIRTIAVDQTPARWSEPGPRPDPGPDAALPDERDAALDAASSADNDDATTPALDASKAPPDAASSAQDGGPDAQTNVADAALDGGSADDAQVTGQNDFEIVVTAPCVFMINNAPADAEVSCYALRLNGQSVERFLTAPSDGGSGFFIDERNVLRLYGEPCDTLTLSERPVNAIELSYECNANLE